MERESRGSASVSCSVDPFVKKEWYDVKTPIMFNGDQRLIGKTPVTKTAGKSEFLSAHDTPQQILR